MKPESLSINANPELLIPLPMTDPEELRHSILSHLYDRRPAAQSAATICRHLRHDGYQTTEKDASKELNFLVGSKLLEGTADPLGSTLYYNITSEGTLAYERQYR